MKVILVIALLASFSACADPVFQFVPSRTPHYFFQFMDGFELSDSLPQSSKCNSTSSILATDLLRDYNNIYDNYYQKWNKEGVIAFAKTLGEIPDFYKNCKQTFNFVFKNTLAFTSQFDDAADFYNSLMEHLTQTVVGIYTQASTIYNSFKKDNLKESEVDQLILDLGKLARLIFDFEKSGGRLLHSNNIQFERNLKTVLAADPGFNQVTKMFKSFFSTFIDAVVDDKSLREQTYACSSTVQTVELQLEILENNVEEGLEVFKLLHPLAVNCIAAYEGLGVKIAKWIETSIPGVNQLMTNILVQMGDISSYLNEAIQLANKGTDYDKIGENMAKALVLVLHDVDFKKPSQ